MFLNKLQFKISNFETVYTKKFTPGNNEFLSSGLQI